MTGDELTIADIAAYSEIAQGAFLPEGEIPALAKRKNVQAWMRRVAEVKEVAEVTRPMLKLAATARKRAQAKL